MTASSLVAATRGAVPLGPGIQESGAANFWTRAMVPFSVPPAAKACLDLVCQLRDGARDDAWGEFVTITASWQHERYSSLWERAARLLGLTVTTDAVPPTPHAVRESTCALTGRVAWRE